MSVRSALGEPLKAEIEILDINAEEAATLSAKVAPPEAFKSAGLDYNAAIASLRASLQRRSDGRAFISLSSDRVVTEPFVDLILEASWNTGRIMRDYTMLFDPPALAGTRAPIVVPAQTSPAKPAAAQPPVTPARQPTTQPPVAAAPVPAAKTALKTPSGESGTQQITVKAGDTAGRIATLHQPASVSLDQMLVAMLRSSPDAFIGGNVNRIKAGALVTLPSEADASVTPAVEAQAIILAQSQDFNSFRRNLASSAPSATVAPSAREASGKLQAKVDDKKPTSATPDKLTLSKGAITNKSDEAQLATARNAKEAASRAAEVAKNLKDLSQIAAASSPVAPVSAAPAVQAASAPASAVSNVPTPAPAISAVVATSAPSKPASKAIAPEPVAQDSFLDSLLENPMVPAGAAGLIALLAGFGFYKVRQRKRAARDDSTFADSKLQPDSFFGNSGGKNINTTDTNITGSSMIYSPSQLDAVDDVDPVAEADVYLAYGRDLQAEEILKDALRTKPDRLAIHQKLLEIYAKRRDAKAYEAIATLAFNLTNGLGQDWEQICEKGLALDPNNALYLPGGQPQFDPSASTVPAGIDTLSPTLGAANDFAATQPGPSEPNSKAMELDLDLDFSLDEPNLPDGVPDAPEPDATPLPALEEPQPEEAWSEPEPMELLALEEAIQRSAPAPSPVEEPVAPEVAPTIDAPEPETDDSNGIDFDKTQVIAVPRPAEAPAKDSGMMAFDLGDLSLDFSQTSPGALDQPPPPAQPQPVMDSDESDTQPGAFPEVTGDPLETKLALAEEFKAIGDDDGARALIEEVIAEATGDIKVKAQQALSKL